MNNSDSKVDSKADTKVDSKVDSKVDTKPLTKLLTKPTAKKVKHTNNQLCKFVEALGVKEPLSVYSYQDLIYINIEFILPILLVDLKWFLKNSESPTHYIKLSKIFINKYGMTKLISQSSQPAAFRLQDYLYDLFYQVESTGYADKTLPSRTQLFELNNQLTAYKEVNTSITQQLSELNEQIESLRADLATSDEEIATLKDQNATLEIAARDADHYQNIATKLAKCVRYKSRKPPPEAFDENLEIDDIHESDEVDDDMLESIVDDALDAKLELKRVKLAAKTTKSAKSTKTTKTTKLANSANSANSAKTSHMCKTKCIITAAKPSKSSNYYYIMREIEESQPGLYQWHLTDIKPDNDHTVKSDDYLNNDTDNFKYPYIHYRTLKMTAEKKDAVVLFLSLNDYNNDDIEHMFSVIANT